MLVHQLILALAVVLAAVAAFWRPQVPRPHLGWLAVACLALNFWVP